MKNRTWLAAAAATGAVVVTSALWIDALQTGHTDGGLLAEPRQKQHTCAGTRPVGSLPDVPEDTPLDRVLAYIDQRAASRHSAVFTGLSVDEDQRAADVWRIPSAAFDADVCAAAEKGVTVRLHDTDINRVDLDALADRIGADMSRWDGVFELREVGVDERGWVSVGVDDPGRAEPVLHKEFGDRYVKVERVGQAMTLPG